jgi:hypothetical protein
MTKLKVHVGDFPTGKNSQFLNGIFSGMPEKLHTILCVNS